MKLGCVIMAAGASRRFGENKLLRTLGGIPLYQRALEAVPADCFAKVAVVTGCGPIMDRAKAMGFAVVENHLPAEGVSRTIRLGLEALADMDGVLFMTADQPLLTGEGVRAVTEVFLREPGSIAAAAADGVRGNPCLFPRALFPALLALEGDRGGSAVIRANPHLLRLAPLPPQQLADADTAQALARLEACFSTGDFV